MKKILFLTALIGIALICSPRSFAFSSSGGLSSILTHYMDRMINIDINIMSTSVYRDFYSQSKSTFSVTQLRAYKTEEPADEDILKYVENNYPELNIEQKKQLSSYLLKTKEASAILKKQMVDPTLTDTEVMIIGVERNRFILKTMELEQNIQIGVNFVEAIKEIDLFFQKRGSPSFYQSIGGEK